MNSGERKVIALTADEIVKATKKATGNKPRYKIVWGTVTEIEAGPPATLTLTLQGSSATVSKIRYLASYSPTVGDSVIGKKYGRDLVVLGTLPKPPLYLVLGGPEGSGTVQVQVIDVANNTFSGGFSYGINTQVAINPAGTLISVDSADLAFVIEFPGGDTWNVTGTGSGYGSAFSADGDYLYTCTGFFDTICKIDVASRTLDATLTGLSNARYCLLSPDGDYLYVWNNVGTLWQIDLSTFTIANTLTGLPNGEGTGYACISSDGAYLYMTATSAEEVFQIEISSFTMINSYTFGGLVYPEGICISDDDSTIYVVGQLSFDIYVFDTSSWTLTSTNPISDGVGYAIAYFGGHLYIVQGGTVAVLDPTTFDTVTTIALSHDQAYPYMALQQPG